MGTPRVPIPRKPTEGLLWEAAPFALGAAAAAVVMSRDRLALLAKTVFLTGAGVRRCKGAAPCCLAACAAGPGRVVA